MHVLINATSVRLHGGGATTVLKNLLPALLAADPGTRPGVARHSYTVVARREVVAHLDPHDSRVTFVDSPLQHGGITGRIVWELLEVPLRAHLRRADVVFSPAGIAVPVAGIPQVVMHQNMAPFESDIRRLYRGSRRMRFAALRIASVSTAWMASDVVFISNHARRAIGRRLTGRGQRHHLIYLGRDPAFNPSAIARAPPVLQQLGISPPYVLAVSHFYRYKNLVELVQGFALAAPRIDPRMTLVIAGAEHEAAYACAVRTAVAQARLQQRVRLVGSVRYDWMPALYAAAELFVFPSICESFPQIPIEAMASGAATITSNVPPMPEVVGIGAGQFDPSDPRDIARAILDFLATSAARDNRAELRERGLRWVERYSWARAGHELLGVFEGAAAGRP